MKLDNITRFFREVKAEMKSVAWPSKADLQEGTIVVITMSALVAVFLSLVDLLFRQAVSLLF